MSEKIPDSSKKLLQYIIAALTWESNEQEKTSLAYLLLQHQFNIDKTEIIVDRSINLSKSQIKDLNKAIERLNKGEPIQYILGEADFYGRKFFVSPGVLIPRNETEELVDLIIKDYKDKKIKLLDIGTGTGCIPITLAKELKLNKVFAVDFDPRVIKVARQNAEKFNVEIDFLMLDILKESIPLTGLDVIVSNPPYVTESERILMRENVLNFEPHTALFVSNENPLLYYERIADLAKQSLKEDGRLYFEINEQFGQKLLHLLEDYGYVNVQILQDINGKDRMVKALNRFA